MRSILVLLMLLAYLADCLHMFGLGGFWSKTPQELIASGVGAILLAAALILQSLEKPKSL